MNFYLRVFGGILIIAAALLIGKEYALYAKRRIDEEKGFLHFLVHIKGEISRFLTAPLGFLRDFTDESLDRLGFFSALNEGESMYSAYKSCEKRCLLASGARKILNSFFSDFGKNYKDAEVARTESFEQKLSDFVAKDEKSLENNVKAIRALLCAAALGAVILLI